MKKITGAQIRKHLGHGMKGENMKALSRGAEKVFFKVVDGLEESGSARKIDNTDGAFMAVNVDRLQKTDRGVYFAVAHNYLQNGDVMADPDMTFMVSAADGRVYPMTFQQDNLGIFNRGAYEENGRLMVAPRIQRDITKFANTWMRNIKEQQF